jgi:hypothetical protein
MVVISVPGVFATKHIPDMEVRISDITKPHDRIRKETVICTISRDVTSSPTGRAHGICVHGDEWLIRPRLAGYAIYGPIIL